MNVAMSIQQRVVGPGEMEPFFRCLGLAMGFDASPEDIETFSRLLDHSRSIACFDGADIVGTLGTFPFDVTVPGGAAIPMTGTTTIGVRPTHRRRGLLRGMMAWHLQDARDHGEPLMGLWASESTIYERWGFGPAAIGSGLELRKDRAALRAGRPTDCAVDLIDTAEYLQNGQMLPVLSGLWDAVRPSRPGMLSRTDDWWLHRTLTPSSHHRPAGGTDQRVIVCSRDGRPTGYAIYCHVSRWERGLSMSEVVVREVIATDRQARLALWHYLLGIDLTELIRVRLAPPDDVLPLLLTRPRAVVATPSDSLWLRVLDVPRALEARAYGATDRLVLEVEDRTWPENTGRWALDAGPDGARCSRTTEPADLAMPEWCLGATYLGGERFGRLARAGHVSGTPEAVRRADALFAWEPLPWCPFRF